MVDYNKDRPTCCIEGCNNPSIFKQWNKDRTKKYWGKYCGGHNQKFYNIGDWKYKKYRKDYCENIDGRLGFKCTSNIIWEGQLDADHIDGNHNNHSEENIQTLCKVCHSWKTWKNKDWKDKTGEHNGSKIGRQFMQRFPDSLYSKKLGYAKNLYVLGFSGQRLGATDSRVIRKVGGIQQRKSERTYTCGSSQTKVRWAKVLYGRSL